MNTKQTVSIICDIGAIALCVYMSMQTASFVNTLHAVATNTLLQNLIPASQLKQTMDTINSSILQYTIITWGLRFFAGYFAALLILDCFYTYKSKKQPPIAPSPEQPTPVSGI